MQTLAAARGCDLLFGEAFGGPLRNEGEADRLNGGRGGPKAAGEKLAPLSLDDDPMLAGGFGKWLMPGESSNLEFRLDRELTPDNYQIICEMQNGQEPIIKKQMISVTDFDGAKPAR